MKVIPLILALIFLQVSAHAGEDIPYHHLALFAGLGKEDKSDHRESIEAFGLEYEYRFSHRWGIGLATEFVGDRDIHRNEVLVIPVSAHFGHLRIFGGPGHEWADGHDEFLLRMGAGYEFALGGRWSLAPELVIDLIEGGDKTWLLGLSLGYHF